MRSEKDWTHAFQLGKPSFEVSSKFLKSSWAAPAGRSTAVAKPQMACHIRIMKKSMTLLFAAALAGILGSCAPSTPQHRIQQRPQDFARLSEKDKELVSRGEIAKGMEKDAVALAWGSPASRVEGLKDGETMERWDYRGQQPVVSNHFHGGYRSGYYGPYRYSGYGVGFGPQITYLPYRKASVWFVNERVDEWERQR